MSLSHLWISDNKQNHTESLPRSELQKTKKTLKMAKASHHIEQPSPLHLQISWPKDLRAHASQSMYFLLKWSTLFLDSSGGKKILPVPQSTFPSVSPHWQTELPPLSRGVQLWHACLLMCLSRLSLAFFRPLHCPNKGGHRLSF